MSLSSLMTSIGILKRPSTSRDEAQGVETDPFTTIATDVLCDPQPMDPNIQLIYSQREQVVSTRIWLMENIGAAPNDIFIVVDPDGLTHTFLVKGIATGLLGRTSAPYYIDCEEIN